MRGAARALGGDASEPLLEGVLEPSPLLVRCRPEPRRQLGRQGEELEVGRPPPMVWNTVHGQGVFAGTYSLQMWGGEKGCGACVYLLVWRVMGIHSMQTSGGAFVFSHFLLSGRGKRSHTETTAGHLDLFGIQVIFSGLTKFVEFAKQGQTANLFSTIGPPTHLHRMKCMRWSGRESGQTCLRRLERRGQGIAYRSRVVKGGGESSFWRSKNLLNLSLYHFLFPINFKKVKGVPKKIGKMHVSLDDIILIDFFYHTPLF